MSENIFVRELKLKTKPKTDQNRQNIKKMTMQEKNQKLEDLVQREEDSKKEDIY